MLPGRLILTEPILRVTGFAGSHCWIPGAIPVAGRGGASRPGILWIARSNAAIWGGRCRLVLPSAGCRIIRDLKSTGDSVNDRQKRTLEIW